VVSFGSMAAPDPDALQLAVVTALRAAGLRAIIQAGTGGPTPETAPDLLPAGVLDHRALFPRSAVVVHHGGAGTSHAAAAAGVPSVVVPHVGDQPFRAERLHRLGAAPAPLAARGLHADALAGRLREATTSAAIASGARSLAQLLGSDPGTSRAVERLEALGSAREDGVA
ncbi:MAG TPA: nucleotide disphospho-sugar-binding domain-containing protein, partial [Candidatus Limnocylindrales bacterium]|nr:nucleotide disphospho-sugar-binding domain-containing protein [Candidatus Limnocylindrales bacterium]